MKWNEKLKLAPSIQSSSKKLSFTVNFLKISEKMMLKFFNSYSQSIFVFLIFQVPYTTLFPHIKKNKNVWGTMRVMKYNVFVYFASDYWCFFLTFLTWNSIHNNHFLYLWVSCLNWSVSNLVPRAFCRFDLIYDL